MGIHPPSRSFRCRIHSTRPLLSNGILRVILLWMCGLTLTSTSTSTQWMRLAELVPSVLPSLHVLWMPLLPPCLQTSIPCTILKTFPWIWDRQCPTWVSTQNGSWILNLSQTTRQSGREPPSSTVSLMGRFHSWSRWSPCLSSLPKRPLCVKFNNLLCILPQANIPPNTAYTGTTKANATLLSWVVWFSEQRAKYVARIAPPLWQWFCPCSSS